jgi:hypothetical protein
MPPGSPGPGSPNSPGSPGRADASAVRSPADTAPPDAEQGGPAAALQGAPAHTEFRTLMRPPSVPQEGTWTLSCAGSLSNLSAAGSGVDDFDAARSSAGSMKSIVGGEGGYSGGREEPGITGWAGTVSTCSLAPAVLRASSMPGLLRIFLPRSDGCCGSPEHGI